MITNEFGIDNVFFLNLVQNATWARDDLYAVLFECTLLSRGKSGRDVAEN